LVVLLPFQELAVVFLKADPAAHDFVWFLRPLAGIAKV